MTLGAIILTGGASRRMGEDKAAAIWLGVRAVDRVFSLVRAAGAQAAVTVGKTDYGLPFVQDAAPLGGPVGGILAGAAWLASRHCESALVLAVDAPTIRPEDLAPLLDHGGSGAAFEGFHLPFVIKLTALDADAEAGWPVRRLIERGGVDRLVCRPTSMARMRGANTPVERDALLRELAAHETSREGGSV